MCVLQEILTGIKTNIIQVQWGRLWNDHHICIAGELISYRDIIKQMHDIMISYDTIILALPVSGETVIL